MGVFRDGWRMCPGRPEPRAAALLILAGSWCDSLNPLIIPHQAWPRLLLLPYLLFPPLSSQGAAVEPLLLRQERESPSGQGSGGCREQPFPCTATRHLCSGRDWAMPPLQAPRPQPLLRLV